MIVLDFLKRFLPIVTKAHFLGSLLHFGVAPGEFFFGDSQQLLRRIVDEFGFKFIFQPLNTDRRTNNCVFIAFLYSDEFLSDKSDVALENLMGFFVWLLDPPREHGIISVIEFEPFFEFSFLVIEDICSAKSDGFV